MRLFALLILFMISSGCASGWTPFGNKSTSRWVAPFVNPNELGTELEKEFADLLDSCQAFTLTGKNKYSAVPPVLQKDVDIRTTIAQRYTSESTYNLFRYIFKDRNERLPNTWVPSRLLSADLFTKLDLPRPEFGSGSIIHSQSCAAIIEAAVRAKLKPPQSSLEGALSSEFQNHYDLAVVKGTFYSPLWSLLSRSSEPSRRLSTLLTIWRAYQDEPDLAASTHYYLRGFRGVALFQVAQQGRTNRANVKANASGNWLVASLEASGHLDASTTSQTQVVDYITYVFSLSGGEGSLIEARNIEPLPDVNGIRAEFRRARLSYSADRKALTAGVPHIHSFELSGVPPTLCSSNEWSAQMLPLDTKLRTTKPMPGDVELLGTTRLKTDTCRFQVQYLADPLPEATEVTYWLVGAPVGSPIDQRLEVPVTFQLLTTDLPTYEVLSFPKEPAVAAVGGTTTLKWVVPVLLRDEQPPLADSTVAPTVRKLDFVCEEPITKPSVEYLGPIADKPGQHQFAVTTFLRAGQNVSSAGPFKSCELRLALNVAMRHASKRLVRGIQTDLNVPVVTEAAAAGVTPEPTSSQ